MPKARKQLAAIMARDGRICGVHMGGCGRFLQKSSDASVDHITPKSFVWRMPADKRVDFLKNWNVQPMCHRCNNESKGGQLNDWPLYKCRCHYLQIGDDRGMYIHERTEGRERKHLLVEQAVGDGTGFRLYAAKLAGSGNKIGWSRSPDNRGGHLLAPVPEEMVNAFNWFELVRVGEGEGAFSREGENGESCIFFTNGLIVPQSPHRCANLFPVTLGHLNLRFDPFKSRNDTDNR